MVSRIVSWRFLPAVAIRYRETSITAILYIAQTNIIRDLPLLRLSQMPNISQHIGIITQRATFVN